MDLNDLEPITLIFLIAFVSVGILVLGMLTAIFNWSVGTAIFLVGVIGIVTSPLTGPLLWWANRKYGLADAIG